LTPTSIASASAADDAHAQLLALLPDPNNARDVLAFHRNMLLHGQRVCVWSQPRCEKCVLREWCDYYADLIGTNPDTGA
jgi:endonuclease-3